MTQTDEVTTHWEDIADLRQQFPALTMREGVRRADHGRLVTSASINAGTDIGLHLEGRLSGVDAAHRTALHMAYRGEVNQPD